ncbi:xanthine/uracil transporter [Gluconacetobacter johannae DSM 13595]|uniref:Purine permease n=1 Tax=Gluconacetobacter johannae TaxID=112140 RepID=A0A7W4J523_9PROT|nr:nucleobase:cation symporter-2 family protein [Gluconacetobacter johannae]MBB2174796.1 purine permease [Gluconacetobacter johannae]GBQ79362.1 xanthine/uracil transporter [Gluconacetobacter johannae DSM 13595]
MTRRPARHDPVEERLPPWRMLVCGLQHVLVIYAGVISVPLIFGAALGLGPAQLVLLVNASILTSGVATLIQTLGVGPFGARLPLIQASSFIALPPMMMIARDYDLPTAYGAVIGAGLATCVLAPFASRLARFFPPVVIGSVITVVGLSLMPAAANWLGGGRPGDPGFGAPAHLLLGFATLALTLLITARASGTGRTLAILLGLAGGAAIGVLTGQADFGAVRQVAWVALPPILPFGRPAFHIAPILIMTVAMMVILVETTGNCLAVSRLAGRAAGRDVLTRTYAADGLSTLLGGLFGGTPYNAFAQNTGLIALTGIRSRFVVATAGGLMVAMGLFPRLGAAIACLPRPVLGGSAILMFGMTAMAGIQDLARVRLGGGSGGGSGALVPAVAIGAGILPMACPTLFAHLPGPLRIMTGSGVFLAAFSAVSLNLLLSSGTAAEVEADDGDDPATLSTPLT